MKRASYILEARLEPSGAADGFFAIDNAIPGSLIDAREAAQNYLARHNRGHINLVWLRGSDDDTWYARDFAITFRIRPR